MGVLEKVAFVKSQQALSLALWNIMNGNALNPNPNLLSLNQASCGRALGNTSGYYQYPTGPTIGYTNAIVIPGITGSLHVTTTGTQVSEGFTIPAGYFPAVSPATIYTIAYLVKGVKGTHLNITVNSLNSSNGVISGTTGPTFILTGGIDVIYMPFTTPALTAAVCPYLFTGAYTENTAFDVGAALIKQGKF